MKPWLLNILACPVCKDHPLAIHILQVKQNEIDDYESLAGELMAHHKKGVLSEPSLRPVHNLSNSKEVDKRLTAARTAFGKLSEKKPAPESLQPLVDYFYGLEIIMGALTCSKCNRWYPIGSRINSIPELLPDAERKRTDTQRADLAFLRKYKNKLPTSIISSSKPIGLKSKD